MNQIDRFTCEQVFERLDDFLDRELSAVESKLLEEHLAICDWCASVYKFQSSTVNHLKVRIRSASAPSDLMAKLSAVLDRADSE